MGEDRGIFNVRVYGILVNAHSEVLVTDEVRFGRHMTKFPGGGLHYGEGIIDCIKREFREELDCEIEIVKHFYTTDFFQPSAFHNKHQLISIYYLVKGSPVLREYKAPVSENEQSFRWILLSDISEKDFTFPIDKKVAGMLKNYRG